MQDGQRGGGESSRTSDSLSRLTAYMRRDKPSASSSSGYAAASARPGSMTHPYATRTPSLAPSSSSPPSDPSAIPLRMLNSIAGLTTVLEKKTSQEETHNQLLKDMRADFKDTLERNEDLSAKMDRTLNAFNETTAKTLKADIGSFINHDLTQLRTELSEIRAASKEMTAASAQLTRHEASLSKLEHQPAEIADLKTRMGSLECAFDSLKTELSNHNASIQPVIALAPVMQQVLVTMSQIQATLLQQSQQQQPPQIIYQTLPPVLNKHPSLQRVLQPENLSSNLPHSTPSSPQMLNNSNFTPPSSNQTLAREDTDPLSQPRLHTVHMAQMKDKLSALHHQTQEQTHFRYAHISDTLNKQRGCTSAAPAQSGSGTLAVSAQEVKGPCPSDDSDMMASGLLDATTAAEARRDPMLSHIKAFVHTDAEVPVPKRNLPSHTAAHESSNRGKGAPDEPIKQTSVLPEIAEQVEQEEAREEEEDMQATQIISSQTPETEEIPRFLQYTQATMAVPSFGLPSSSSNSAALPALTIPSYRERERSQSLAPTLPPSYTNTNANNAASSNRPSNSSSSTTSSASTIQLPYKKRKITQMEEEEEESTQFLLNRGEESSENLPDIPTSSTAGKSATRVQKQGPIGHKNRERDSSPDEPLSKFTLSMAKSFVSSSSNGAGSSTPRGSKAPRLDSKDTGTPSSSAATKNVGGKPTPAKSAGRSNTAKRVKPFPRKETGTRQSTRQAKPIKGQNGEREQSVEV